MNNRNWGLQLRRPFIANRLRNRNKLCCTIQQFKRIFTAHEGNSKILLHELTNMPYNRNIFQDSCFTNNICSQSIYMNDVKSFYAKIFSAFCNRNFVHYTFECGCNGAWSFVLFFIPALVFTHYYKRNIFFG